MFKLLRRFVALILLAVVAAGAFFYLRPRASKTFTFTREDLQQKASKKFPFGQSALIVKVTYSNPVVKLDDESDRIGIGLDAVVKVGDNKLVTGKVAGEWQVRYEASEGALYFDDPTISKFDVNGLSSSTREIVARAAQPLLQGYLRRVPVYKLKKGDLKQELAQSMLKSVTVKNGKLVVVVGAI
jgi:hypothetical protein